VRFAFDPAKDAINRLKHSVSLSEAVAKNRPTSSMPSICAICNASGDLDHEQLIAANLARTPWRRI
jgi:hypothetical protein